MNFIEKLNEIIEKRNKAVEEIKNITNKHDKKQKNLFTVFTIIIGIVAILFIFTPRTMLWALGYGVLAFCCYCVYSRLSNKFLNDAKIETENVNKK